MGVLSSDRVPGPGVQLLSRYRQGEKRASQLEAQLSQAQLQALKMQLSSFSLQQLHSISALLHQDKEAAT